MNHLARFFGLSLMALFALAQVPAFAQNGKTQLHWFGQAAFKITSPGGKVFMIDPWIRTNPLTPPDMKSLEALGKIDFILVTHGHFDHFADAPALALMHDAPLYSPGDMNSTIGTLGILPAKLLPRMNKSGSVMPAANIKVTMVRAEHSSVISWKNPATNKDEIHPGGEPVGFIIELENGFKIYHMGDTGLFPDMKFIAEYYKPDLVLIPIGGNFTMDPSDAAFATREWLKPKMVLPMHYGANPLGKGTPEQFSKALGATSTKVLTLQPGQTLQF
jgi:L-ascorbate metabolism protein UlaG (beta-lactamase superfamily)